MLVYKVVLSVCEFMSFYFQRDGHVVRNQLRAEMRSAPELHVCSPITVSRVTSWSRLHDLRQVAVEIQQQLPQVLGSSKVFPSRIVQL